MFEGVLRKTKPPSTCQKETHTRVNLCLLRRFRTNLNQEQTNNHQNHRTDVTVNITFCRKRILLVRRCNVRQKGIVKNQTTPETDTCRHTEQQTQPNRSHSCKHRQSHTRCCAQITEKLKKRFLVPNRVCQRRQNRGKQNDNQKGKRERIAINRVGMVLFSKNGNHMRHRNINPTIRFCNKLFLFIRRRQNCIINRKDCGGNHQGINRVCPIVQRPSAHNFRIIFD